MNTVMFLLFLASSIILGLSLHIMFLKKSLADSLIIVANSYDLKIEQKEKLQTIVEDYYNSLPIDAHTSLNSLDRSLLEVEKEINKTKLALESNSIFLIKSAKKGIEKLYRRTNKKTKEKVFKKASKIKSTWEYSAEEVISLVSKMIKDSSKAQENLGCKIRSKYNRKMPTNLALREIIKLGS